MPALRSLSKSALLARGPLRGALGVLWQSADRSVRVAFGVAAALAITSSLLLGLGPLLLKHITDGLAQKRWTELSIALALLIVAYAAVQWLARCLAEIKLLEHGKAERRLYRLVSGQLFTHVLRLPLRFHLDRHTGGLGQVLSNGLEGYRLLMQHLLYSLLPSTVELLTVIVVVTLAFSWHAPVAFGLCTLIYVAVFVIGLLRIAGPSRCVSQAQIRAQAAFTDSLLNYETVKLFNAEERMGRHYDDAQASSERAWGTLLERRAANGLVIHALYFLILAAVALATAGAVMRLDLTVGDFVMVIAYLLQIVRPLELLGLALRDLAQAAAFIENMLDVLAEPPECPNSHTQHRHWPGELEVRFENVSFAFGPGHEVLRDVSFVIPAGRIVAVVGESGAGKSTLVRLLLRSYEPDSGRILLNGVPATQLTHVALREMVGVVPQEPVLFNATLMDNIAFGRAGSSHAEVRHAARIAQLDDLLAKLPRGYDTCVGERGLKLSAGEKQRVAVARAVLKRPRVYVFDEATSALDGATERALFDALKAATFGKTTLLIAHRLSTVAHADEILVMRGGVIVERGSHASLLAARGPYARLWDAHVRSRRAEPESEVVTP